MTLETLKDRHSCLFYWACKGFDLGILPCIVLVVTSFHESDPRFLTAVPSITKNSQYNIWLSNLQILVRCTQFLVTAPYIATSGHIIGLLDNRLGTETVGFDACKRITHSQPGMEML